MSRQASRQVTTFDLRRERLNLGLSRAKLAEKIGVTERVLILAETGSTPRPENARKIADYFGFRVTDLWPPAERAAA